MGLKKKNDPRYFFSILRPPCDKRSGATGDKEPIAGTSGNSLIANVALTSCNTILEDYHSSRISKAIALSEFIRLYWKQSLMTSQLQQLLKKRSAILSPLLRIIKDTLQKTECCGHRQRSHSPQPIPEGNPDHEDLEDIPPPK